MNLGLGMGLGSRAGGGSAPPFDPTQLANVQHWYRADQGVSQSGGFASQWNDMVGSAHLLQATAKI